MFSFSPGVCRSLRCDIDVFVLRNGHGKGNNFMIRALGPAPILAAVLASSGAYAADPAPAPVVPAAAAPTPSTPEAPPAAAPPTEAAQPEQKAPEQKKPPAQKAMEAQQEESMSEAAPAEQVSEELRVSRQGLGLNPGALQYGGLTVPPKGPAGTPAMLKPGQINFHGFLRAPMRLGFGSGDGLPPGFTDFKIHAPPYVPDSAYNEWQYTNQLGGPWTELVFSYGDARVSANVMVAAYNLSDAGWKDLTAQLGINEAWVTVNQPDFFGSRGGFIWNVGAFHAGYGGTGRYDAGKYETYLFGRTHGAGETVTFFYDLTPKLTFQLEHGIGALLEVQRFVAGAPDLPYLPGAGPVQQLPTLLHHAHAGFTLSDRFTLAVHYLDSFTHASTGPTEPDGHIWTAGIGAKLNNSRFGGAFLGYSHLDALNAQRVGGAIEVLHSREGWNLAENFWGPAATGNGTIDSVMGQYTFSLATFLQGTDAFYGQSADLLASVFGMYNKVKSDIPNDPTFVNGSQKLKFGGDVTYLPLYWLGLSARYDLVQPDMSNSHKSFQVVSPRLLFRTSFVAHEEIYLMYSQYFNGSEVKLAFPSTGMAATPDSAAVSIIANMYW
jgi:hypothetical protein